jgi:hypothetical protein
VIPIDPAIEELELVIYAKDQPEYIPLPTRRDVHGTVVTCWKLSWKERLQMFLRGRFYLTLLTFNRPLQPIRIEMGKPDTERS